MSLVAHSDPKLRYLRVRDASSLAKTFSEKSCPVPWLPEWYNFFQIDETADLPPGVIGMDAASAVAVMALQLDLLPSGARIWDMCAAPGMKWMLINDLVKMNSDSIRVVATDVNENRLRVMRSLARKHGYTDAFRANVFLSVGVVEKVNFEKRIVGEKNRISKRKKLKIIEKLLDGFPAEDGSFDRVLVDAECTHDGSFRHVEKHAEDGFWNTIAPSNEKESRFPYHEEERFNQLIKLQKQLITNGFNALKVGGILVYSTCSLDARQNQEIVQYLLDSQGSAAELMPLPFAVLGDEESVGQRAVVPATRVHDHCCLFHPDTSGTSGLFVAIVKRLV